ncbi:hypothetical protein GCM10007877_25030 [Marinibactrum halimedae]|uniref:Thioredoxin family protein n=1 Tax=Marinibactrum halimedae TaxID=1444977 RepID=A0AA37T6M9_9GAMM|nr:hypothetical protein GCM10007877_25030 [Marinibactrum halimedae]
MADTLSKNFEIVHIDIGEWNKNLDFAKQFGNPIAGGIPSIAIIDNNNEVKFVAEGGTFANARRSQTTSINQWFENAITNINTNAPVSNKIKNEGIIEGIIKRISALIS